MALTQASEGGLKISNAGTNGQYLQKQSGNTGGLTWADVPPAIGGGTGLDVNDNVKIRFGTGNDLEMYHSGTTNWIVAKSHNLDIDTAGGNENAIKIIQNGTVEIYYDSSKKLATDSAGVEITGALIIPDGSSTGNRISIGAAGDLKIYHDGSDSYINNTGTGNLMLRGDDVHIQSTTGENMANFHEDGSVRLLYDNSLKLETTSWGVEITGTATVDQLDMFDNEKIRLGTGADLQIYHDGSNSFIKDAGTGGIYLDTSFLHVRQGSAESMINAIADGSVELYHNGTIKFKTEGTGVSVTSGHLYFGDGYKAQFGASQDLQIWHDPNSSFIDNCTGHLFLRNNVPNTGTGNIYIQPWHNENSINANSHGAVELYYDNSKKFETTTYGTKVTGRIAATTSFTGSDSVKLMLGDSDDLQIYHTAGSDSYIKNITAGSNLQITSANEVQIKVNSTENAVECNANGSVDLYHDNSKKLATTSGGIDVTGAITVNGAALAGGNLVHVASLVNPNSSTVDFTGLTSTNVHSYLLKWSGVTFTNGDSRAIEAYFQFNGTWDTSSNAYRYNSQRSEWGDYTWQAQGGVDDKFKITSVSQKVHHGELHIPMHGLTSNDDYGLKPVWGCSHGHERWERFTGLCLSTAAKTNQFTGVRFFAPAFNIGVAGRFDLYKYTY